MRVWPLCALALALGSCAPKSVPYLSRQGDFSCRVPWGWSIYAEGDEVDYTNVTFTGPFDPAFYRGKPSISVRWYSHNAPHWIRGGVRESYASYQDFIDQMMRDVYGPEAYMKAGPDAEQDKALAQGRLLPDKSLISVSGWQGYHFVVYNNLYPRGAFMSMGLVKDERGVPVVRQRHGYVILPMNTGFYVLVYPATRDGYDRYKSHFYQMIKSFKLLKEGPAGEPL